MTGVSLILPIGFVPFVFSARVTALPATRAGKRINCLCPDQLCRRKATVAYLFDVMSKYITHCGMIDYGPMCVCVCVCFSSSHPGIGHISVL